MRTLSIAGLAMVTAVAATPALAQQAVPAAPRAMPNMPHAMPNAGGWQGRGGMPNMQRPNPGPGVTWNRPNAPISTGAPRVDRPMSHNWSGGSRGPGIGGNHGVRPLPGYQPIQPGARQSRWGGTVGGRWYGGSNAPGGWKAYHRPNRGWTLPRYWIAPSFFISDYGLYGLSSPPYGYNWTRYYDDAVLTDSQGRVYDSVGGIDWDSDGYGYGDSYGAGYGEDAYGGEGEGGYGYADGPRGGYGADYAPPPPVHYSAGPPPITQGGYTQTYSTSGYGGGGYVRGGYWYPPVTTTTITVQSAPVVTTTTTEYVQTYRSRRVYKAPRRVVHTKTKIRCACN